MNWDQIAGQWKQLKGKVQERWGEISSDELDEIGGRRERLEGMLQERYGKTKEQAKREVEEFLDAA